MIRNKIVAAAYPVSVHFKRLLINGLDISVIVPLNNGKNETRTVAVIHVQANKPQLS